MTRLRWTDPAMDDFLGIVDGITTHNPDAAARVGRRIIDATEDLVVYPYMGKPGRSPDTRELVVTRFPYLIVYSVEPTTGPVEVVAILRVLHGAMQWPQEAR